MISEWQIKTYWNACCQNDLKADQPTQIGSNDELGPDTSDLSIDHHV